jgi:hypothetical protein
MWPAALAESCRPREPASTAEPRRTGRTSSMSRDHGVSDFRDAVADFVMAAVDRRAVRDSPTLRCEGSTAPRLSLAPLFPRPLLTLAFRLLGGGSANCARSSCTTFQGPT